MAPRPKTAKDFWENVNASAPHECWEWKRSCTRDGYGQTTFHGDRWSTHRLAYFLSTGDHPGAGLVLHKCDNPPCCNPDHLYLGDAKQNKADEIERNRVARGERHGNAKLNDEMVTELRRRVRGGETIKAVAKMLGIPESTAGNAAHNYWKHVTEPPLAKRKRAAVTEEMRNSIIADWCGSRDSQETIAARYGVDQTTVSRIVRAFKEEYTP